jgi:hypothetical protein
MSMQTEKLGLIAGNGKFPFLVLEAARAQGYEVIVAAIQEEAFPEIESHGAVAVHWLSLGELSKHRDLSAGRGTAGGDGRAGETQADFSSIRPDWRLAKLLLLTTHQYRFTSGARSKVPADRRIHSKIHMAAGASAGEPGVLTEREPGEQETQEYCLQARRRQPTGAA